MLKKLKFNKPDTKNSLITYALLAVTFVIVTIEDNKITLIKK